LEAVSRKLTFHPSVDLADIAVETEGYSGADLQAVVYNAHLEVIHASIAPVVEMKGKGKDKGKAGAVSKGPEKIKRNYRQVAPAEDTDVAKSLADRAAMTSRVSTIRHSRAYNSGAYLISLNGQYRSTRLSRMRLVFRQALLWKRERRYPKFVESRPSAPGIDDLSRLSSKSISSDHSPIPVLPSLRQIGHDCSTCRFHLIGMSRGSADCCVDIGHSFPIEMGVWPMAILDGTPGLGCR